MMSNWVLLICIAGISSVLFNYINRYVLKDGDDSTTYAWWFELIRTLMFLPFCFLMPQVSINIKTINLFVGIGITEFFSIYVYMKMHSSSELSISTIVSQLRLIWIPIFAFIFLKERLTFVEYFGIIMILLGQIVVASPKKMSLDNGIKFALLSSILVAVNSILGKIAAPIFSPPLVIVAMGLPALFGFPILMKNARKRIGSYKNGFIKKIIIATIFNAFTMVFMLLALRSGPVSKVIGVFQSISIMGVYVGIFLLHEKGNKVNKILGSMAVLFGMLLLL